MNLTERLVRTSGVPNTRANSSTTAQPEASYKITVALCEEASHLAADDPQEGDGCRLAGDTLERREGIAEPPAFREIEREIPGEAECGFHHSEEEECAKTECPSKERS